MMQKGGINILDFDSKPKELRPGSRISQITDRKVCEHVYGSEHKPSYGYESFIYEPINYKDDMTMIFNYCPKCGKRLHRGYFPLRKIEDE